MNDCIKKVTGVIIPMITPFSPGPERVDETAVARIVEYLVDAGTSIFLLGTTGESSSISQASRRRLVTRTVAIVNQRSAVYAGISGNCLSDSLDEAACWADLGVTAAVAHVPSYYPINGEQMRRYYETLADGLSLPLILYNIPATTHHSLPLDVADQLSRHPRIIGLKDSERDMDRLKTSISLWKDRADFSFLVGWASQSAQALQWGADGLVPSTGNLVPGLYQSLFRAAVSGDSKTAGELQALTNRISEVYQKDRSLAGSLAALKALMSELDLCQAHVLPPLVPVGIDEMQLLKERIQALRVREMTQSRSSGYPSPSGAV